MWSFFGYKGKYATKYYASDAYNSLTNLCFTISSLNELQNHLKNPKTGQIWWNVDITMDYLIFERVTSLQ